MINVVAAVIEVDGKILCVQRGVSRYDYISYKYEFPGGKIEEQETPEQALKREIAEELDYDITIHNLIDCYEYNYPDFTVKLHFYHCGANHKNIVLKEHQEAHWLYRHELDTLDWAAADLAIIHKLKDSNV